MARKKRNVRHGEIVQACGLPSFAVIGHGQRSIGAVQEGMRFNLAVPLVVLLGACGGDDGGSSTPDAASNVPAMITISGEATKREGITETAAAGAVVAAYKSSDPSTPVAMTTTDANGMYTMTFATGGAPLDGYLKATLAGFLDLYLYPPRPLVADFDGASLNIINQSTLDLMHTICQASADPAKSVIAVLVADAAETAIAAAKVSANPAAGKYCYNGSNGLPDSAGTMTVADGIAYMLNAPVGEVTVSAMTTGSAFGSHKVTVRAGTFTTTVIQQ
jgi:hypothetical protein